MSIAPGSRVGSYEVLSSLGAGGMGEVYRARDTRLGRDVAIKILPADVASDPERLARFHREAQVLASLNHPNIAAIHGFEDSSAVRALVMEVVDGPTLADRIAQGPIPIGEALPIAKQIAEALEAAHEQGIVHRDLKPANIKVRPDGTVKVLDFGLAKLVDGPDGAGQHGGHHAAHQNATLSPTITSPAMMTGAGIILGTAAYMAPEQAKGRAADKRADIWAFGVVLYEMLTGRSLFVADSIPETLAFVMTRDVDLTALPSGTPTAVRAVIARCLVRDPRQRLRDIGDARLLLGEPEPPAPAAKKAARSSPILIASLVLGVVALGVAADWLRTSRASGVAVPDLTLSIVPPAESGLAPAWAVIAGIHLAPDGSALTYIDADGQHRIRDLRSLTVQEPGVAAGTTSFWSADSRFIGFDSSRELRKMRYPDGAFETIVKTGGPAEGATWSADGRVLYALVRTASDLWEVPASGGEPRQVTLPGIGSGSYFWPQFIAGTSDFLVGFEPDNGDGMDVYLATLRDRQAIDAVRLMRNDTGASFTPAGGGQVLFVRNDTLYGQRLDLKSRALVGDPAVIVAGVASVPGFRLAEFSASDTGVVAWRPGGVGLSQLNIYDRTGRVVGTAGPPSPTLAVRLSPDEQRLLLASQTGQWLVEPGQKGLLEISHERNLLTTVWSADGEAFLMPRPSQVMALDVSAVSRGGKPREVAKVPGLNRIEDVSPDGQTVLFTHGALATELFAARLDGSAAPQPVVQTGELVFNARFSPDGKWIVYEALPQSLSQDGQGLYVQPFPGPGLRRQISPRGKFPVWRRDGAEIVFFDQDHLSSIRVTGAGADLRFAEPVRLFDVRRPPSVVDVTPIAVSRDGSRVFVTQPVEQPDSGVIHVRFNAIPNVSK